MYYSLAEAAKILGYASGSVIRDYIYKGIMKGTKIGRNYVIDFREIKKRAKRIQENKEANEKRQA
jgi:hypothetical protein